MNRQLERFLTSKGIMLLADQRDKLKRYKELILDASKSINLISRGDLSRLEELHFADSLAPVNMIPAGSRLADWGSGAGLPGIPLAIARPDIHVTLVESRQKKAAFLLRVIGELQPANLELFADRGEKLTDTFDIITVRAIGSVKELLPELMEHLQENGGALFYKTPGLEKELVEAESLIERYGFKAQIEYVTLPQGGERLYLLLSRR